MASRSARSYKAAKYSMTCMAAVSSAVLLLRCNAPTYVAVSPVPTIFVIMSRYSMPAGISSYTTLEKYPDFVEAHARARRRRAAAARAADSVTQHSYGSRSTV